MPPPQPPPWPLPRPPTPPPQQQQPPPSRPKKKKKKKGGARKSQQDNYSRDTAARNVQLGLRRRAVKLVADFIGPAEWSERVPLQASGPTTFGFLVEGPEGGDPGEGLLEALEAMDAIESDEEMK